MTTSIIAWIAFGARVLAGGMLLLSLLVAATHWAVRAKHLQPFGAWARFVRSWSDGLLRPLERRIVRSGGNPQDGPFWLVAIAVVVGLGIIALVQWAVSFVLGLMAMADGGTSLVAATLVHYLFSILMAALFIRVIASWVSLAPHGRFMRIIDGLTSWLIDPIRRVLPAMGPFDLSPLVAYFLLYLAEKTLIGLML